MTTHYESLQLPTAYPDHFNVTPPSALGERDMWPRKPGFCIRPVAAPADAPPGTLASRELIPAQWGLVPHWVKSASDGKLRAPKLVNARSETASTTQNFRDAWLQNQRCIVPMQAFFADDWRSGKAVPTRISRIDGKPMGVAGLWASWTGPDGDVLLSYTVLTVNANNHALMRRYGPEGNDKHMPVILNEGAVDAWLTVRVEKAKEFMRQYPANWLAA
ncbi:MAG: SOS response-associated peptidase, partial [Ferruginibacter sp.]|nr:SOS response-associated peptidase [Rhodoferax sp.]